MQSRFAVSSRLCGTAVGYDRKEIVLHLVKPAKDPQTVIPRSILGSPSPGSSPHERTIPGYSFQAIGSNLQYGTVSFNSGLTSMKIGYYLVKPDAGIYGQ